MVPLWLFLVVVGVLLVVVLVLAEQRHDARATARAHAFRLLRYELEPGLRRRELPAADEGVTWQQVAGTLPADVVDAILGRPAPTTDDPAGIGWPVIRHRAG